MALLTVVRGYNEGAEFTLTKEKTLLGRNAECDVVINLPPVSREHALIHVKGGKYYLEDLKSRNSTYLNDQVVATLTELKENDKIRICDTEFLFHGLKTRPPLPEEFRRGDGNGDLLDEGSSTVEATLSQSSKQILETQPAEKLTFLLDLTSELTQTLDLDRLLPKVAENLFKVFKHADRSFVIFGEDDNSKLIPRVIRTRRGDETNARFSRTIVRRCLETGTAFLSEDATADLGDLTHSIADARIRSVMCAPLKARADDKAFGVIQLDTDRSKKFTPDDLKLLMAVASQAAVALENARLHQTLVARAGLERDLQLAHQVQLSFLPKSPPALAGYQFFAHYESALDVGGDYYDFIPLPGQRVAVMIGDVAGKGVSAALISAKLSSDARFAMLTEPGPAEAVCRLNEFMQQTGMLDRFVTLEAALVNPHNHEVTIVNAGHTLPILYRAASDELVEPFSRDHSGLPLGVIDHYEYVASTVTLNPGDLVVLYSDGLSEAQNKQGKEFHTDGILQALRGVTMHPQAVCEHLVKAVKQHSLGCKQHDDITVVCFGRNSN